MKKLTLITLSLLCFFSCTENNRTENLIATVDSLKVRNDSLTKILTLMKIESNYWCDSEYDGESLIEYGIANPIEFIKSYLRKKLD